MSETCIEPATVEEGMGLSAAAAAAVEPAIAHVMRLLANELSTPREKENAS